MCYNPVEKSGRRIFSNLQMEEVKYPFHLSNIDHSEKAKVIVYSYEPRIWSENDDLFVMESTRNPSEVYRSATKRRV